MTETEKLWQARLADWRASGKSAGEFCQGKSYRAGTMLFWSSKMGRGASGWPKKGKAESASRPGEIRLARVVTKPARPADTVIAATSSNEVENRAGVAESAIVIETGAARVAVRSGFDAFTLRQVLAVLGGAQ